MPKPAIINQAPSINQTVQSNDDLITQNIPSTNETTQSNVHCPQSNGVDTGNDKNQNTTVDSTFTPESQSTEIEIEFPLPSFLQDNNRPKRRNWFDKSDTILESSQKSINIDSSNILSSKTKRARKQTNKQFDFK